MCRLAQRCRSDRGKPAPFVWSRWCWRGSRRRCCTRHIGDWPSHRPCGAERIGGRSDMGSPSRRHDSGRPGRRRSRRTNGRRRTCRRDGHTPGRPGSHPRTCRKTEPGRNPGSATRHPVGTSWNSYKHSRRAQTQPTQGIPGARTPPGAAAKTAAELATEHPVHRLAGQREAPGEQEKGAGSKWG